MQNGWIEVNPSVMWVKIHKSSRAVIAICDSNLLGKKFEEGIRMLDISKSFFEGQQMSEGEVLDLMRAESSSATFNIIGKESIQLALEAGIIEKSAIHKIKSIPFIIIV